MTRPSVLDLALSLQDYIMLRSSEDINGCWNWQWSTNTGGYGRIPPCFHQDKKDAAHQLSYTAFRGQYDHSLWVLHKCNNRKCVNPDHLYLGTPLQNKKDNRLAGTMFLPRGIKLTEEQVLEIRRNYKQVPQNELAKKYGVNRQTIYDVGQRKSWGHL